MNEHIKEFDGLPATFHIMAEDMRNGKKVGMAQFEQQGDIIWPFAVHPQIFSVDGTTPDPHKWIVTHLPSGYFTGRGELKSKELCLLLIENLKKAFTLAELESLHIDGDAERYRQAIKGIWG